MRTFLENMGTEFLGAIRRNGNEMDDVIDNECDELMQFLDPNYYNQMTRLTTSNIDINAVRNTFADSEYGELMAKRVSKQRFSSNPIPGGGGSGSSTKEEIKKLLNSKAFNDAYGSDAKLLRETIEGLSNEFDRIRSLDDLTNNWIPKGISLIEQNVKNSRQLRNLRQSEKQMAAKSRAETWQNACDNLVNFLRGGKKVAGEVTKDVGWKTMKRIFMIFLIVLLIGAITWLNKETILGDLYDEGWEKIKGLPKDALDAIRKEKHKAVSDSIGIIQDTLLNTGGEVSDVKDTPVVSPDPNNTDGVIVTPEPADGKTTPAPAPAPAPKDMTPGEEEDVTYLDKRLSKPRTGLA